MNPEPLFRSMEAFPAQLRASVAGLTDAEWRWRPAQRVWSILEVVAHLADEEVEDFRPRLSATLTGGPLPSAIDPERWAVERSYDAMDPDLVLERFEEARASCLDWLRSLVPPTAEGEPDWSLRLDQPETTASSAGDLLASWAAHDLLHLRQITRRRFELVQRAAAPHDTRYAGAWERESIPGE